MSFIFRADRTTCTTCYSTDPANGLGLGIAAMAAIQGIVGIYQQNVLRYEYNMISISINFEATLKTKMSHDWWFPIYLILFI